MIEYCFDTYSAGYAAGMEQLAPYVPPEVLDDVVTVDELRAHKLAEFKREIIEYLTAAGGEVTGRQLHAELMPSRVNKPFRLVALGELVEAGEVKRLPDGKPLCVRYALASTEVVNV